MLGSLNLKESLNTGISAYSVVVTVRTDKASVKADISYRECRNKLKLGRNEILFNNTVLLV